MPFQPLCILWLILTTAGQIGLIALLITLFVVKRLPQSQNAYFVNFVAVSLGTTLPPGILLYGGGLGEPRRGLCVWQVALTNGGTTMYLTAFLIFAIHTLLTLRAAMRGEAAVTMKCVKLRVFLLALPYIIFILLSVFSGIIASHSTHLRLANPLICLDVSQHGIKLKSYVGYCVFSLGLVTLIVQVYIIVLVWRKRPQTLQAQSSASDIETQSPTTTSSNTNGVQILRVDVFLVLRLLAFCVFQVLLLLLSALLSIASMDVIKGDRLLIAKTVIFALHGLETFLIFGTQKNVLQVWGLRGSENQEKETPTPTLPITPREETEIVMDIRRRPSQI
ncbi:hypothetical protein M422DRAFT_245439 [Sphaerobolus stellatus SS14]|nr:hypothetical protein M422DRAFT_245439 [Sphaerobolus stellatus SS14]